MELTDQQHRFFDTFGYLVFRQLFRPDEIGWITREFESVLDNNGGGNKHDGAARTMLIAPVDQSAKLCTLLDDPRILGIAGGILGKDFNYAAGDGNYYTGDTGWHPDGSWGELFACKIAFYLDPVKRDTGALRVIPGSHKQDHFVRAHNVFPGHSQEMFGIHPSEFPGNVALESNPGDLVIFNHDLYHASFGGGSRRRMFTMNLTRSWTDDREKELVRHYVSAHSPGHYKLHLDAGMTTTIMLDTASPERMVHLQQCGRMHDELFPEYARQQPTGMNAS